jgi:hypothetical protein
MSFERRALEGGGSALVATELDRAGFLVAFTERGGGSSAGPFGSLNLSQAVGDDPDAVMTNRGRVVRSFGLDGPFALPEQVHGAGLAWVDRSNAGAGFSDPAGRVAGADALASSDPGVPLAVLTADCLPVALASPASGVLAVVHAGWRGLAAGIIGVAVRQLGDPGGVMAAIGPAIGPDHYEVGGDVVERVAAASELGAVTERRDGRVFLDLAGTAEATLRSLGVGRVVVARVCTACEPGLLFSHRRDEGRTGRQAVVAVRR